MSSHRVIRSGLFLVCSILIIAFSSAVAAPSQVPKTPPSASGGSPPAGVPSNWWSSVQKDIRESEYAVTRQDATTVQDREGAWQASNRAHGFRTLFARHGIRVVPRTEAAPSWEWGLALLGYGRGGQLWPVADPSLHAATNRIDYGRGGIVEWYENAPRGLEQGFTLSARPEKAGAELRATPSEMATPRGRQDRELSADKRDGLAFVQLELMGTLDPAFSTDGQAIDFRTAGGVNVIHYAALRVTDTSGRELPAWMEGFAATGERTIRIVFDDTDAVYPVSVDPLATSPAWTAEGDQASALYGSAVATAGDVNGDGYSDVLVGAPSYDNGQMDEGRAYLYLGSASGLSASPTWTAEGDQEPARFGFSVATAGDVNGDGYADVVVGAYLYANGESYEGRAYLYLGSASGLAPSPAWTAESDQASAQFGYSVATAGDVNGDGYADVIVGAFNYRNGPSANGRAYVYLGSASGLASSPVWTAESDQADSYFGVAVGTAGDVNGDGYADVTVGAPYYTTGLGFEGRAYVYLGSASGLASSPAWTADGDQMVSLFGNSLGTAGDVNGDGYADVIVGAYNYTNDQVAEGRTYVYLGSAVGLASSPAWTAEGDLEGASFGYSVATAGDVNGDGYADVIVGGIFYNNGETEEGRAYVYLGSASGLASSPAWTAESDQESARFGCSVATAGDVNGDGYADVIVGAPQYDNGQTDEGRATVYYGSAAGPSPIASWTAQGVEYWELFGQSVASAGDVNGDGYADVIVGAYGYGGSIGRALVYHGSPRGLSSAAGWIVVGTGSGQFGVAVAGAGDVNGDGYGDVIVGEQGYSNGQDQEGRAYVYHGSAAGLSSVPAWTAEGNQQYSVFGQSVAAAGDVNGDGYADVIVGAPGYGSHGAAFAYYGSPSGLSTIPSWTAESNQLYSSFGRVSTAGDVNGDGYSDVIVGAHRFGNIEAEEGRTFVYHGSPTGLLAAPAWTAESDSAGAHFGLSVSTAGDVNGDGYADVIVGAHDYGSSAGKAFVYHGSAAGLSSIPAWTAEGDQSGDDYSNWKPRFGRCVASAGDVNGDGFADVIVGAYFYDNVVVDSGQAFVYHGSASGLSPSAAWTGASDQYQSHYGLSAATAGDVNGDGYADLIVSAYAYDVVQQNQGRTYLYYGNGGLGLALLPRQRRTTDAGPIAHLGMADGPESFRLNLLGRTPFGRGRVWLEGEVKPLRARLDGINTQVAVHAHDTGASGVELSELETGLFDVTPYHWRVRLRYDPVTTPFAQRSRWLTMPWKGWQEAMLRTADTSGAARIAGLNVGRATGEKVTLSWSPSCRTTDTDYAIYEGVLREFYSHALRFCSTGGAATKTFAPLAGDTYYIVVPLNATSEGSYGKNSAGVERPAAPHVCLPRLIDDCP